MNTEGRCELRKLIQRLFWSRVSKFLVNEIPIKKARLLPFSWKMIWNVEKWALSIFASILSSIMTSLVEGEFEGQT